MRNSVNVLLALVMGAALGAGPAHASSQTTVTTVAYNYVPLFTVTVTAGDSIDLHNLDTDIHGIKSVANAADGKPLFDTGQVLFLEDKPVNGVNALAPGSYPFYCFYHADIPTMYGTLVVNAPD